MSVPGATAQVPDSPQPRRSRRRIVAAFILALASAVVVAGCAAGPEPYMDEPVGVATEPITGSDAVSRAMQWVHAKLLYCQSPNHMPDYDSACSSTCNRHNNKSWDPYRSDCSGLISWSWKLPPPGYTTLGFAPFSSAISHTISAIDLQPGDAVNNSGHVMLFKHWVTKGKRAVFIEEPGCSVYPNYAHQFTADVTIKPAHEWCSHSSACIHVSGSETFDAIRYNKKTAEKTDKAKAVRKWSNARRYHGKQADYLACTGDQVRFAFTFKNVGTATWRDVKGRGKSVGSDVFLVTTNGKKDPLTHHKRYSIRWNKNHHVRGDRKAPNCSNKNGCRKTTFIRHGMLGRAPKKPGIYRSRWRLRDYSKAWGKHSNGFGPKVQIKLKVIKCEQATCGCQVWCSDGKSHRLSSSIQSDAQCKTAAANYCRPGQGQGSLYLYSYQVCQVAGNAPQGGAGGSTSTASDSSGGASASSSGGAGGSSGGGAATPYGGSAGAGGAGSSADPWDVGGPDDANSIPIVDNGDDSAVQDDPGFSDDGFNGDADSTGDVPPPGCSVGAVGGHRGTPPAAGALLLLAAMAETRRRSRRRRAKAE
jgi:uncharacterized membrane protein YgcG